MPSRLIQLKDLDSGTYDSLFPITTGEAVSVTYGGSSTTLQSVVDLIPNASGSGGGGATQTIVAKNISLTTSEQPYLSLNNESTYYTICAPSASTSTVGMVQLSNAIDSTSASLAATSSAVKAAYDHVDDAILKSIGTAAGDIIYFSGSGSPTVLPKGTAGQVLTMNSGATAPSWATPSQSGVGAHSLLSSSVHIDTTDGIPANGNIIVGNGSTWTSQSFETFADTYHAVPLVGHFDSTTFNAWFTAAYMAAMNNVFYDDYSQVLDDNPSLSFLTMDLTVSQVVTAMTTGKPVYVLASVALSGMGTYRFIFEPKFDIGQTEETPTIDRIIFSSSCGYDIIGGIDIMIQENVGDSDIEGGGLIFLPRLIGGLYEKIVSLPFTSSGNLLHGTSVSSDTYLALAEEDNSGNYALKYSTVGFGSDTTKYLRNDGQWAVPAGGGGGTSVTLPSGYNASTGITLDSSNLTTVATIGGTELKLKAPAGGGGTSVTLPNNYSAVSGITLNTNTTTTIATVSNVDLKIKVDAAPASVAMIRYEDDPDNQGGSNFNQIGVISGAEVPIDFSATQLEGNEMSRVIAIIATDIDIEITPTVLLNQECVLYIINAAALGGITITFGRVDVWDNISADYAKTDVSGRGIILPDTPLEIDNSKIAEISFISLPDESHLVSDDETEGYDDCYVTISWRTDLTKASNLA